jgi:hypothetical protein
MPAAACSSSAMSIFFIPSIAFITRFALAASGSDSSRGSALCCGFGRHPVVESGSALRPMRARPVQGILNP